MKRSWLIAVGFDGRPAFWGGQHSAAASKHRSCRLPRWIQHQPSRLGHVSAGVSGRLSHGCPVHRAGPAASRSWPSGPYGSAGRPTNGGPGDLPRAFCRRVQARDSAASRWNGATAAHSRMMLCGCNRTKALGKWEVWKAKVDLEDEVVVHFGPGLIFPW